VFRALSTLEGGLTLLAPGFDIVTEAESFGREQLRDLRPESLKDAVADELMALLPMLRRLPRRADRITAALEGGRLSIGVRLFADERERGVVGGWLQQIVVTVLAATAGLMAVVLLAIKDGPVLTRTVSLYQFLGYSLLVISSLLALRVLAGVFRAGSRLPGAQHDAADERGLPDVLQGVRDHADQPHGERHRRVPPAVHDPRQVGVGDAADQLDRLFVHRVVVAGKHGGAGPDAGDLRGAVPVPDVVPGQPELCLPLRPRLCHSERVRHVVVLHAGQVPDQPGDRVGVRVEPHRQLLIGQPGDGGVHFLMHALERVYQQLRTTHKTRTLSKRTVVTRPATCVPSFVDAASRDAR